MGNCGFFYSKIIYFGDINGGKSEIEKTVALLMGIVLILSPVSSVQASDVSSESQIVVTSEVSNESESESLDSDENESMETQSEVAETSIESTVQSEMDNETETSANDVKNEMFQQIGATSGNMIGSYIECGFDNNYQCDGGLNVYPTGYTTLSNVYTVPKRAGIVFESLKAVSVYICCQCWIFD